MRAYTRHKRWILERAWLEDDDMIIELQRRVNLDFLMNPDADVLLELERQRSEQEKKEAGKLATA